VDIAAWLRNLGLERYEQAFRDSDISLQVLTELTDEDLKELGLTLGHRRLLLRAIKDLGESETATSPATDESAAIQPPSPATAERRQLTVMFVDLAGSTGLAARLDPEDMGALMRRYQERCTEGVQRWGGHVAKYMGDGVLAYFGYPRAHEDDAERAVRPGLDLAARVGELGTSDGAALAVRVGIATGLVMVGDLIGAGAAREEAVVGETPNRAARLQTLAAAGKVVIDPRCRRLVGGLFELEDLGRRELKGFDEPVQAWRVLGDSAAEGRFEALHGQRLTPLIGREHELAMLMERLAWAREGDGQVVLIAGEAGIGKSRLLRALREALAGGSQITLRHFCSPYHTNSALHPTIAQLERAAALTPDDRPAAKLEKLEALLARATDRLEEAVPLIGALLGIPSEARYPALNLSPQQQKQRTLEVLVEQLAGLARERPVLALYEDLHWADPSTLELLDLVVERVRTLPVLLVLAYRPEFRPPWTGQSHVTALTMNRLGRRQGATLVDRIAGKALPAEILEQIVARTDGVPLFVEELTRTVLESGLLRDAGERYELAGPLPPLAIPATLHDSLMARLDRLAPVKEVAQSAAVIGREFSYGLLAAVTERAETDLEAALDQLVASELVFRRGTPPDATYRFKHALVQDAAYQSLLKSSRHQLHAKIAQVLECEFPDAPAEVLAHHFTEAGLNERAVGYWHKAGERAAERSALREAAAHLGRGLELVSGLPAVPDRARHELALLLALGPVLMATKGWAAPEVEHTYLRARDLAEELADDARLFTATWNLWHHHQIGRCDLGTARRYAEETLVLARRQSDPALLLQAHHSVWTTCRNLPDLGVCLDHAEQGRVLYDPVAHRTHKFVYAGHDPGVCARITAAWSLWLLGFPDQALERAEEGLALADELAHSFSLLLALAYTFFLHQFRRAPRVALERAERAMAVSREQKAGPQFFAAGKVVRGWALAAQGQPVEGVEEVGEGLDELRALGAKLRQHYYLALLAEAQGLAGRVEQALDTTARALEAVDQIGDRWYEAEIHRLKGALLLAPPEPERPEAEICFHRGLVIAREQNAKMWELRAAMSLVRLWRDQGKRQKAHDLLAPLYDWFTEGFETADLKDAKALLDELA
jgi:predicted ATPase/class 3 adenylate cyclase